LEFFDGSYLSADFLSIGQFGGRTFDLFLILRMGGKREQE
jgi:hypothetical protein